MTDPNGPEANAERALARGDKHFEEAERLLEDGYAEEAHEEFLSAAAAYEQAHERTRERQSYQRAGLTSARLGALERAGDELKRAVELARASGLERELAIALGHLGMISAQRGATSEAAARWHEAVEVAERGGALEIAGRLTNNLGQLELDRGALDAAERTFTGALELATRAEDAAECGAAESALGQIARRRGDDAKARAHLQRAQLALQEAGDVRGLAATFAHLGQIERAGGHLERSHNLFSAALRLASAVGDVVGVARAHTDLGNVAAARGQNAEARGHYRRALALERQRGGRSALTSIVGTLVNLANLLAVEGRLAEARDHYLEADQALRAYGPSQTSADVLLLLGQVEARLGRLTDAEATFARATEVARASEHARGLARLALCRAALDHARGDIKQALDGYQGAIGDLERGGVASDIITGHLVLAECGLAVGDPTLASESTARAATLIAEHLRTDGMTSSAPPRELLDVEAMRARIGLQMPGDDGATRRRALNVVAALTDAGRHAEGWALRLVVADRAGRDDDREAALEIAEQAEALDLRPLAIDALTCAAAMAPDQEALKRLESALAEAHAMGLGLLVARVRRRLLVVARALGDDERAERVHREALAWAKSAGAAAEIARLERLTAQ